MRSWAMVLVFQKNRSNRSEPLPTIDAGKKKLEDLEQSRLHSRRECSLVESVLTDVLVA